MRSKRYSEFVRIHTYKIAEEILRPVLQKSYLIKYTWKYRISHK